MASKWPDDLYCTPAQTIALWFHMPCESLVLRCGCALHALGTSHLTGRINVSLYRPRVEAGGSSPPTSLTTVLTWLADLVLTTYKDPSASVVYTA